MTPLLPIGLAAAACLLAPFAVRLGPARAGWLLGLAPLLATAWLLAQLPAVAAGAPPTWVHPLLPDLLGADVALAFRLDGLALFFALLVTGIGALILPYAGRYMADDPHVGRFLAFLGGFMTAMLLLVLSDDLVTFYIGFELTTVASFLLIGFKHSAAAARRAARQALLVTAIGGLALVLALLLLAEAAGTFRLSELTTRRADLAAAATYAPALALVVLAAFTKSAQFPFHSWLPNAMEAPTPVSAYLHSATMVKAGLFLLARLSPVFSGDPLWDGLLQTFGAATALVGAWMSLAVTDLKRVLAWTTVLALGLFTFLLGLGTPAALDAFFAFVLVHALYKAALFMLVGALDHATGERRLTHLHGLRRALPTLALAAALAGASKAGLPPLLGFASKEATYLATLDGPAPALHTALALVANAALVATAFLVALRPFAGPPPPHPPHRPGPALRLPTLALGLAGLLLFPLTATLGRHLVEPALAAALGRPASTHLAPWHGLTPELALSAATVALGWLLYRFADPLRDSAPTRLAYRVLAVAPDRAWARLELATFAVARWTVSVLQQGRLRRYVGFTLAAIGAVLVFTLWRNKILPDPPDLSEAPFYEWVLVALMLAATLAAAFLRPTLRAVLALSAGGFVNAILFLVFGGPDLAMTQFLVETLLVVIIVLTFARIPPTPEPEGPASRAAQAVLAAALGGGVAMLGLAALTEPFSTDLATYFGERSYTEARGRNVVNVILTDFRALDTLGEIAVVALAGLGIYLLLVTRARSRP